MRALTRRELLRAGGAAAALAALGHARGEDPPRPKRRVVVVVLGGGVRRKETTATPANVPALLAIAAEGVLVPSVRATDGGHHQAIASIFTGRADAATRDGERPASPTVFEYARKGLGLDARDAWLVPSGGDAQAVYGASTHKDWGASHGASLPGEGVARSAFRRLLERHGSPRPDDEATRDRLRALRTALSPERDDASARAEAALVDELSLGQAPLTGAGAADARALRYARTILLLERPALTAVVLTNADLAHTNYPGHVDVIKRNDREIGSLWAAIKADPELASSTTLFVLPEMGRDAAFNRTGGLDHGDGSPDVRDVFLVAAGAGIKRGAPAPADATTTQVCPTVCALLGVEAKEATAGPLRQLLA